MTLLLCVCGGAWADTETIFSANAIATSDQSFDYGTTEITSAQATISGGSMFAVSLQPAGTTKVLITKAGYFQHTNNNTYFKIVLNSALKAGDVISAKYTGGTKSEANKGIVVSTTEKTDGSVPTADCTATSSSTTAMGSTLSYTVTSSDEYVGNTTLYVYRAVGATQQFDEFKVTREVAATAPTITTQPVSASYKQNATATALTVAATTSAGNLSYQWYSNTTASTEGATAIDGETTASYIPSTAALGKFYYYCAVTDDNGTTNSEFAAITVANTSIVGYTEAISGQTLAARSLTSEDANVTISDPIFGSAITDYKGTSKTVYIDGTSYTNTDSWRKSANGIYDNQFVGYTLTVASGYKMNISAVNARLLASDDVSYTWFVEILNSANDQVWRSGERTTTRASSGKIDNVNVSEKDDIQGLTGSVTVKLWVKQSGGTKYFSINYLQLTVETEVDTRPTYAMSVSSNDETMGTVTPADGSTVTEGESVAFTATPASDGYKFVKWTIDGTDYTENPYTLTNVTATHTAVATFAKRFKVTYDLGEYAGNTGKVLDNVNRDNGYDEVWSTDDDSYTIPTYAHKYLYREGYIFDQWQDGDGNTYASGATINMTKDITLTPTWTATSQSLSASGAETVVTWSFAKADILFCDWQSDSKSGYHTQNVTVNGENIAVPMSITAGKVGNWSRTDAIAQTNQNTKFTIPAISGMVVEIADANKEFSTTTIAGSTEYEGTGTKSISYTYTGTDATIDIVIGESNQYLKTIKVTYPATHTAVTLASSGKSSFSSAKALDFSNVEGLTAYVVSNVSKTAVTLKPVSEAPAATGLILMGTASTSYSIPVAESATLSETNKLVATVEETTVDASSAFVVNGGEFKLYTGTTIPAGKAYLPASEVPTEARSLAIVFDGEATGIDDAVREANTDNNIYNLRGQRVAAPTKGLYIIGGKKVIVK